jgi:hypothetical protein
LCPECFVYICPSTQHIGKINGRNFNLSYETVAVLKYRAEKRCIVFWEIMQHIVIIFTNILGQPIGHIFKGKKSKKKAGYYLSMCFTRVTPKVMPPIYFHGNCHRYK